MHHDHDQSHASGVRSQDACDTWRAELNLASAPVNLRMLTLTKTNRPLRQIWTRRLPSGFRALEEVEFVTNRSPKQGEESNMIDFDREVAFKLEELLIRPNFPGARNCRAKRDIASHS